VEGRRTPVPASWSVPALLLAVAAAFLPALGNGFVWDDELHLLLNPAVAGGLGWESARWAATTTYAANWIPLTWLSHLLDISLFGFRPAGHHAVNLALHAAVALLLCAFLQRVTGRRLASLAASLLFAVHPLRVESVVWVSERKDLLCGLFFLAGLHAYAAHLRRPSAARFAPVAACCALALLSKPMAVTFPFVLLLLDAWPFGRGPLPGTPVGRAASSWARLALEKWPLFILAAADSAVTYRAQEIARAVSTGLSLPSRLGNAVQGPLRYLAMTAWPGGLAIAYPHPMEGIYHPASLLALAALTAITVAVLLRRGRQPYLPVGWLWFLGMLVPVLGIVQVGTQAVADRYTYLPHAGLFLALCWGVADILPRRLAYPAAVAFVTLVGILAAAANLQSRVWRDNVTLYAHAAAVDPGNYLAHYNLGVEHQKRGDLEPAERSYRAAIAARPVYPDAFNNLGVVREARGDRQEALYLFSEAIRQQPLFPEAESNLARLMDSLGRPADAEVHWRKALLVDPDFLDANEGLGAMLTRLGLHERALPYLATARRLAPGSARLNNLEGVALAGIGRLEEAAARLREAVRLDPSAPHYGDNLRRTEEALRRKAALSAPIPP
jgi:Flp pilus assembly protein TadD